MRQNKSSKEENACGAPNCNGSAVCFLPPWMPPRPRLRLHFEKPSESQGSKGRFRWRNAPKQPTRNTVAKKRAGQEDTDSDYLFDL